MRRLRGWIALTVVVGLLPGAFAVARADSTPRPTFGFATMPDRTQIALAVSYPRGFRSDRGWPALFMMDGYEGGGGPIDPGEWANKFVLVHASVRGTGCSGGSFDLFSRQTALDGANIIDQWIPAQRWSNGRVGIIGHSYPGLTGLAVAETAPKHLAAVAVSGLIDDLYSGESYPGGVPNGGFTLLWTQVERPGSEYAGNLQRYLTRSDQQACAHNVATRPAPDVADDPVLNGATTTDNGQWWASHSLITNIGGVRAPTMMTQQYQDEQTGPQGGFVLWKGLRASVPKRLVLTNGVHDTNVISQADELAWMTCWIVKRGRHCGAVTAPSQRVTMHFETTGPDNVPSADHVNPPVVARDYPTVDTRWTRKRLAAGRYLTEPVGRQAYLSGAGVADAMGSSEGPEKLTDGVFTNAYGPPTTANGPDVLTTRLRFSRTIAIAGPIPVSLWLTTTAPDTDVFVQLVDAAPDGTYQYLQRGLLRASYRAVDRAASMRVSSGPDRGLVYWWHHPFTNRQLLTPTAPYHLQFDIPPVGAVIRHGHELLVQIYSPPALDEFNAYASAQGPAINTIISTAAQPSAVFLPILPTLPPVTRAAPRCGDVVGERCVKPVA
jgi:putative CocE/NonD family hydrolase